MLSFPVPALPSPMRCSRAAFGTFRAVCVPRFSWFPATPARGLLVFHRHRLRLLPFVVGSFLSLPFPLGGTLRTELAPRQTFPAAGTPDNLFRYGGLAYLCRPLEAEHVPQIKLIVRVFVSEKMSLAYLLAVLLAYRRPTHVGFVCASRHVTGSIYHQSPSKFRIFRERKDRYCLRSEAISPSPRPHLLPAMTFLLPAIQSLAGTVFSFISSSNSASLVPKRHVLYGSPFQLQFSFYARSSDGKEQPPNNRGPYRVNRDTGPEKMQASR